MRRLGVAMVAALAACVRELPPEQAPASAAAPAAAPGAGAPAPTRLTGLAGSAGDPLLAYEVRQLKVVAVITGMDRPLAAVEAPDGKTYTVRVGTRIGARGGRIVAIARGRISVEEACPGSSGGSRCRTDLGIPPEPPAPRAKNLLKGP